MAAHHAAQEQERLKLIREIEEKRGSRVISYITIDRTGLYAPILFEDVRIIEHHLRACLHGHHKAKKIDLFIHTPGGRAVAPWALVSLFREYLGQKHFNVLISGRAFSAGTMISLGADEIVMGPGGNIGPIDAQMMLGYSYFGIEDVRGYFNMAENFGLKSGRDKRELFGILTMMTHPLFVGSIQRAWGEGERAAMLLLKSRRKPLPDKVNAQIADYPLRRVGDNGQSIRRTEARQIGVSFVKDAEEFGIDGHMMRLFDSYEHLLQLDVPYTGHEWQGDEHDDAGADVPVALIESIDRCDIAYGDPLRHWRQPALPAPAGEDKHHHHHPEPAHHRVPPGLSGGGAPSSSYGLRWRSLRGPGGA